MAKLGYILEDDADTTGQTLIKENGSWSGNFGVMKGYPPLKGTTDLETYYSFDHVVTVASSANPSAGFIRAMRWHNAYGNQTIDRMALEVTSGTASAVCRWGIYDTDIDGYPQNLIVESGELDCSTAGMKIATVSQAIEAGKQYWFAHLGGVANPSYNVVNTYTHYAFPVGIGQLNKYAQIQTSQSYGAMPSTFPSGTAWSTFASRIPIMGVRFAS